MTNIQTHWASHFAFLLFETQAGAQRGELHLLCEREREWRVKRGGRSPLDSVIHMSRLTRYTHTHVHLLLIASHHASSSEIAPRERVLSRAKSCHGPFDLLV